MKKLFSYLFLSLLVMGVASCSDDALVSNESGEKNVTQTLSVTGTIVDDATTRVSLADGGTSLAPSWEVGDKVFGFYGDNKLTYRVASVAGGVATFSLVSGTEPADGTTVHMIYAPAKNASDLADGQLDVDLSQQDGTLAGVKNHAIMCATATVSEGKLTLSFLNQIAILGVKQFTGLKASTTYTSATFTSAGPTATVKVEGGVLKLVTDDAYGTITANGSFASNASGNTTSTIYFAVPPTAAVEHQFTLVCDDDYRIGAISAKAVAAGKYLYMSSKALRECVDLGLPSHTLWAATNIGATTPEGFGDYFAWGEVETQASGRYWWNSYKWGTENSLTKYNSTDGLTRLLPEDDAATVNWKNSWRIPTKTEFDELINTTYTTLDWTTQNGVSGMKITSKVNGKSIFLPAAGLKDYGDPNRDPGACNYASSDLLSGELNTPYNYKYNSNRQNSNYGRCAGRPVRAVIAPPATYNNSANATTGTAAVLSSAGRPNNECGWVQLWENGPRFATMFVGSTEADYSNCTSYSQEYCGGMYGSNSDAATAVWGPDWAVATLEDYRQMYAGFNTSSEQDMQLSPTSPNEGTNCIWEWMDGSTKQYTSGCTIKGWKVSGKGAYAANSIFFPASGCNGTSRVGEIGVYYTATGGNRLYFDYSGSSIDMRVYTGDSYHMLAKLAEATTGTAPVLESAGCPNNECGWVQLWAGGPKWAVFNVGVTDGKTESFGGYYAWGGCQDKIDDHNTGSSDLAGDTDAATKIWGSYWRMPTGSEIQALLDNCACIWTTQNGVNGFLCTGRGSYSCNSVFLPATGGCGNGHVDSPGGYGNYWSSTPDESKAVHLSIQSHAQNLWSSDRQLGFAVRAVLKTELGN